ncbi:MAG: 4'-phosphopantetheinyl transferase superfamily protein [Variovorax sp.]|nr:MAG: 4'-phosphopantetheinyl transferase superfamily protein [Variovorax sp.]
MATVQLPAVARCLMWRVDLDAEPAPRAVACLSEAEWERARRFVFKRDRQRFVAAHAALRSLLSDRTGVPGSLLDFRIGAFGKPALVEPACVHFNLSHSQGVALIAISGDAELGVDVEWLREVPQALDLADHHFTPAERHALAAVAPSARDEAFLRCWTRKEACLKATGMGLRVDTRSFEVGLGADARTVQMAGTGGTLRLALSSFDGGSDAVCAVARVTAHDGAAMRPPPRQESELCA